MVHRVLLARGTALSSSTGLGRAHAAVVSILERTLVSDWTKAGEINHTQRLSGWSRLSTRWWKHPSVISDAAASTDADLLHITDQEQAHLVPKNSPIPIIVTIHDLFHLSPRQIKLAEGVVTVGDMSPGIIRKMDLSKLRAGLARADLLICISEMTQREVKREFPGIPTALVRHQIDVDFWNPESNPQPRKLLTDYGDEDSKILLLTVGSNEPRKRLDFVEEILDVLPAKISDDINIIHVGSEVKLSDKELAAAFQHAEALLFPSISEGFGYPPAEAMAAGCPVLAADKSAHNEIIPTRCLLPSNEIRAWCDAIESIHSEWVRAGRVERIPDDELIEYVKKNLSPKAQGKNLAAAYNLAMDKINVQKTNY